VATERPVLTTNDGWLPRFYSPYDDAGYRAASAQGFGHPGARHTLEMFEVSAVVHVEIGDDATAPPIGYGRNSLYISIGAGRENCTLIGPEAKIVNEFEAWHESLLTTMVISGSERALAFDA
jgi:hypothetical protein